MAQINCIALVQIVQIKIALNFAMMIAVQTKLPAHFYSLIIQIRRLIT